MDALSTIFLPEFLNRLDDIVVFQPLRRNQLKIICEILLKNVLERIKAKGFNITVEDGVKIKLTRDAYNPFYGARPLRRLVTKYIEDFVSDSVLKYPQTKDFLIKLNFKNEIVILPNSN